MRLFDEGITHTSYKKPIKNARFCSIFFETLVPKTGLLSITLASAK